MQINRYRYLLKGALAGSEKDLQYLLKTLDEDLQEEDERKYETLVAKYRDFANDISKLKTNPKTKYRFNDLAFYLNCMYGKPKYSPQKITAFITQIFYRKNNKAAKDGVGNVFDTVKLERNDRTNIVTIQFN